MSWIDPEFDVSNNRRAQERVKLEQQRAGHSLELLLPGLVQRSDDQRLLVEPEWLAGSRKLWTGNCVPGDEGSLFTQLLVIGEAHDRRQQFEHAIHYHFSSLRPFFAFFASLRAEFLLD